MANEIEIELGYSRRVLSNDADFLNILNSIKNISTDKNLEEYSKYEPDDLFLVLKAYAYNCDFQNFKSVSSILGINDFSTNGDILLELVIVNSNKSKDNLEFIEFVKYLLDNGADISANNHRIIKLAANNNLLDLFKLLQEYGANIHVDDEYPLRKSCYLCNENIIKYLLENNADVHAKNDYCLRCVAEIGEAELVELLLQHGANVCVGNNILFKYAVKNSDIESIEHLIKYGLDVSSLSGDDLICVAKTSSKKIIDMLHDRGVNFETINDAKINDIPKSNMEVLNALISYGVDTTHLASYYLRDAVRL